MQEKATSALEHCARPHPVKVAALVRGDGGGARGEGELELGLDSGPRLELGGCHHGARLRGVGGGGGAWHAEGAAAPPKRREGVRRTLEEKQALNAIGPALTWRTNFCFHPSVRPFVRLVGWLVATFELYCTTCSSP